MMISCMYGIEFEMENKPPPPKRTAIYSPRNGIVFNLMIWQSDSSYGWQIFNQEVYENWLNNAL